jgi:hypothetical protein
MSFSIYPESGRNGKGQKRKEAETERSRQKRGIKERGILYVVKNWKEA